ncbi:hypothetical protein QBC46DRAFT_269690 [Diplogelasinospora grovesii]|uniref:Uncharacterized protein n=1 Tax=Diplogelasinospora grovesii TaxID=303347 RepID=A0AAN6N2Z1_9PEZI|nr:hypothetical protein QBC46DRAFT_269690 [Diplogelasinospora grovesii]
MTTTEPGNAAVRQARRYSTPLATEQMNIMKALTAAEYSRRQFILNFAASKNTDLLIPGQKADAIKKAEDWVANNLGNVSNDIFKYTVDGRLWSTLAVGDDVGFPFAFMRQGCNLQRKKSVSSSSSSSSKKHKPPSPPPSPDQSPKRHHHHQEHQTTTTITPQTPPRQTRQTRGQRTQDDSSSPASSSSASEKKKRSLSLTSLEDWKYRKQAAQERFTFQFFGRWSLSRRRSARSS